MLGKLKRDQKGFTIIEVLIVLAIAGLIMLIVFLAVPALQRNQRNTTRNNEASRIAAAINECVSNRNGVTTSCLDPAVWSVGTLQQLTLPATNASNSATGDLGTGTTSTVVVGFQRRCTADGSNDEGGASRDFAVMFQLENNINRCVGSVAN